MWIDDEVFTGFQIKKTALLERWIRGESKQQIVPWFPATSLKFISLCVCYCVLILAQSRGMQAMCLAKLLLTAGERLIVWSAVSSQGIVCPPDSWNVRDDKRPHQPHPAQHAYQTHTNTLHTYSGMQRNSNVQEDNKKCVLLFLRLHRLEKQNTSNHNVPEITSNIPPWIDSL